MELLELLHRQPRGWLLWVPVDIIGKDRMSLVKYACGRHKRHHVFGIYLDFVSKNWISFHYTFFECNDMSKHVSNWCTVYYAIRISTDNISKPGRHWYELGLHQPKMQTDRKWMHLTARHSHWKMNRIDLEPRNAHYQIYRCQLPIYLVNLALLRVA